MRFRNIHVIINPVSGRSPVDVDMIRSKLESSDAAFKIVLTEPDLGPGILARRAVEEGADLVIAAGGDGTVLGTAEGLIGTGVALGVIPEGTANVFAAELGVPYDSGAALDLLLGEDCDVRHVDVGSVGGRHFLLRVGIGLEASMTVETDPALKNRLGVLAYLWTAFDRGRRANPILYELEIDGRKKWVKGVTCVVCNSGNLGVPGVKLMPEIDPSDGYLNVIVVEQATLRAVGSLAYHALLSVFSGKKEWGERRHFTLYTCTARVVSVKPHPPQIAACDGEPIDSGFPLTVTLEPKALLVAAPARKDV